MSVSLCRELDSELHSVIWYDRFALRNWHARCQFSLMAAIRGW